jgi:hypothetical protein
MFERVQIRSADSTSESFDQRLARPGLRRCDLGDDQLFIAHDGGTHGYSLQEILRSGIDASGSTFFELMPLFRSYLRDFLYTQFALDRHPTNVRPIPLHHCFTGCIRRIPSSAASGMSEDSAGYDLALTLMHDDARARVRQRFTRVLQLVIASLIRFPKKGVHCVQGYRSCASLQLHPRKQRSFDKFRGT